MQRVSAKAKLSERRFLTGPFVETPAPEMVEALGLAGFDIAIIDCEHAAFSGEQVRHLLRAAVVAGLAPLVRVRENAPGPILEALDLGATGLHIPQIANAADAERAVRAARFPPLGERGFNPFVRAGRYGSLPVAELRREAADDTLLVLHIEAEAALEHIDEILAVPGVDVAFLGPYDMSQTLGVPGEVTHPKVLQALRAVVEAARRRGVVVGCFASRPEHAALWLREGVTYLAYSVDSYLFLEAARAARTAIEEARFPGSEA
ncbi:MAG: aldolase [Acidobacteria bacterium]|nr:aldolase [Acidobacteriota bacterium]